MTPLIEMQSGCKTFFLRGKPFTALHDISLTIHSGETLGLIGESGSGKTTVGRCMLGLEKLSSGKVFFEGKELSTWSRAALSQKAQILFQDPYASLDPRMTAAEIVAEPLQIHRRNASESIIKRLFDLVGLAVSSLSRYPHEFSGGQRQRIGIARALALEPRFIVCDEPISALDVSVQAQIVNLLKELQQRLSLAYLFIAHDLAMVKYLSDRVAVMHSGRIIEIAPADDLYRAPVHSYTQTLLRQESPLCHLNV